MRLKYISKDQKIIKSLSNLFPKEDFFALILSFALFLRSPESRQIMALKY